jgi:maltooligosyltrehalose synthase
MDWSGCRHTACNEAGNSVPVATYRLQLSRTLPFMSAKALVPYLDALGISDAYLSPPGRTARMATTSATTRS